MIRQEGLLHVDVRVNDKIDFVSPETEEYEELLESFCLKSNRISQFL